MQLAVLALIVPKLADAVLYRTRPNPALDDILNFEPIRLFGFDLGDYRGLFVAALVVGFEKGDVEDVVDT